MFTVGIDLGTTSSCTGQYKDGKLFLVTRMAERCQGWEFLPNETVSFQKASSCIAFTDRGLLTFDEAKAQVVSNLENTIFVSKRMIGRKFAEIQRHVGHWQFKVVDVNGMPKIRCQVEGETKTYMPEEILAMVLSDITPLYIGVVISVPACFDQSQRLATMYAAQIAGLNVLRLISEPAAAALTYLKVGNKCEGEMNVLVFDLGGGKLDVSVIHFQDNGRIEVKSTAGDCHLGGEDFDTRLVAYFVEEFKMKHKKDPGRCPKALQRLRIECEHAKIALSTCYQVEIHINCLFDGISFRSKLTRGKFEELCKDLFLSTLKPVRRALFDAEMTKNSIDKVVLVGGMTRVPKISDVLRNFFDGKEPFHYINPDMPVVYGASILAAVINGSAEGDEMSSVHLVDVTPYSLLVENNEGVMTTVIPRNSPIPCHGFLKIANRSSIDVYEGEHPTTGSNRLVRRFHIRGLPKGGCEVTVGLHLNANGILWVRAESSEAQILSVKPVGGGLSDSELKRIVKEARCYERDFSNMKDRHGKRSRFISYVYSVKLRVEYSSDDALSDEDRNRALSICDSFLNWIDRNPNESHRALVDELKRAGEELSKYVDMTRERERSNR